MKSVLFVCFLAFSASTSLFAQQGVKAAPEALLLKETAYDFGKIPQGRPVTHDFVVINRGSTPLIIDRVEASCGCTSPEWSLKPVPTGGSSVVKVGFNAASEGPFSKTISVIYNDNQVKTLVISGEVYPSPATPAPLNPSLSLIKQLNR